jgi:hypothetical protein
MSIESQDFQLKYTGTVLMIHVYVRAQQTCPKLQKKVLRAARGPRLDAIAAWMELYPPGRKLGIEAEKFGVRRAKIEEFLRNSSTDVAVFHLCINTDTDPRKLNENITRAARGPRFDDVVSVIELYEGREGHKVWGLIQQVVQQTHVNPASRSFTL